MTNIIARINVNSLSAKIGADASIYSTTNLSNPSVVGSMSDIANVDTTNLQNGSVLVFNTSTNKWTSTLNLHGQDMEGGEF